MGTGAAGATPSGIIEISIVCSARSQRRPLLTTSAALTGW
jgi:hypothetical protein